MSCDTPRLGANSKYKKGQEPPYLITIQFHHRVLDLDSAFGGHRAELGEVQGRGGSRPGSSNSGGAREKRCRGRSLGGSRGKREKASRERGRRGQGPARESGTRPKSEHRGGRRAFGKSARISLFLFGWRRWRTTEGKEVRQNGKMWRSGIRCGRSRHGACRHLEKYCDRDVRDRTGPEESWIKAKATGVGRITERVQRGKRG